MLNSLQQRNQWTLKSYSKLIKNILGNLVKEVRFKNNEIVLKTTKNNQNLVFFFLKKHTLCQYKQLIEITANDVIGKKNRFTVNYLLKSLQYTSRIYVIVKTNELDPIKTCIQYFNSANWLEREVWDFYGIFFSKHTDLRRILTDYGFSGHPLRKDFPLTGFFEIYYDDSRKHIVYENVELAQEYRVFNLETTWIKTYK